MPRGFVKRLVILLFGLTANAPVTDGQSSSVGLEGKPRIGIVKDRRAQDGCGCSLFLNRRDEKTDRPIFLSDYSGEARINLNGWDTILRMIATSAETTRRPRRGDHSWEVYKNRGMRVRVDFIVSGVCPPKDEACEVTNYDVEMSLSEKNKTTRIKGVGLCGC